MPRVKKSYAPKSTRRSLWKFGELL